MSYQHLNAYQEFIDFITSAPTPEQIVHYTYSEPDGLRLSALLEANRNRRLTDGENAELVDYQEVGRIIRWTKIRALQKLKALRKEEVLVTE